MRLTREDIGAWLFRCNPKEWNITAALRDDAPIDCWRVRPSYRLELIEPGDPAIIWIGGPTGGEPMPGVWMVGRTTGAVFDDSGDGYWLDRTRGQERSIYVGLAMSQLASPVPRGLLEVDPRTSKLEIFRSVQMSNPSYLTPDEKKAVDEMIGGWPADT
jgi:hypothetical protein